MHTVIRFFQRQFSYFIFDSILLSYHPSTSTPSSLLFNLKRKVCAKSSVVTHNSEENSPPKVSVKSVTEQKPFHFHVVSRPTSYRKSSTVVNAGSYMSLFSTIFPIVDKVICFHSVQGSEEAV